MQPVVQMAAGLPTQRKLSARSYHPRINVSVYALLHISEAYLLFLCPQFTLLVNDIVSKDDY